MQQKYRLIKCTLAAIVALLHRARKRNSPYMLHAISLESRMIVLHADHVYTSTRHAGAVI